MIVHFIKFDFIVFYFVYNYLIYYSVVLFKMFQVRLQFKFTPKK